jgi:hypothetical protein
MSSGGGTDDLDLASPEPIASGSPTAHHIAEAGRAGRAATLPKPLDAIRAWMRALCTPG